MSTSAWLDPRIDGAGTWTHTAPHRSARFTLLGTVVVCLLMGVAFLLAQVGGRALMCQTHKTSAGHGAMSYCSDYVAPVKP